MHRLRPGDRRDGGFTLLELITTCLLLGIIAGLSVAPWKSWQRTLGHKDTTRTLVAALRSAQTSAVAESVSYRVDIAATVATTYRLDPSLGPQQRGTVPVGDTSVTFGAASFAGPSGTGSSVYFYPRGAASKGSVEVRRTGRSKVYIVSVEGLTARVSYTE